VRQHLQLIQDVICYTNIL